MVGFCFVCAGVYSFPIYRHKCTANSHFPQNASKQSTVCCAQLEAPTSTACVVWCGSVHEELSGVLCLLNRHGDIKLMSCDGINHQLYFVYRDIWLLGK